jgi:hypothetical protein
MEHHPNCAGYDRHFVVAALQFEALSVTLIAHSNPMQQTTRKAAPFVLFFIINITAGGAGATWAEPLPIPSRANPAQKYRCTPS